MPPGTEVGLGPGHTVRWGPSSAAMERGTATSHFSADVDCGQTVAHLSYCQALVVPGIVSTDYQSRGNPENIM